MLLRILMTFACLSVSQLLQEDQVLAQPSQTTSEVLQLVPPDSVALITLQTQLIAQDESMRMMPLEVISAVGLQQIGIDPLKIERIDAIIGMPGPAGIQAAAVVTFSEEVKDEVYQRFEALDPKANKGVDLFAVPNTPDLVIFKTSPRQALVGPKFFIMRLVKTALTDGRLRQLASGLGEPGHFSTVVAVEPVRDLLIGLADSPQLKQIPEVARDVSLIASKTNLLAMRMTLGKSPMTAYLLQTSTEAEAADVGAATKRLMQFAVQSMIQNVQQQIAQEESRLPKSFIAYLRRLSAELEKQLELAPTGNRLLLKMDGQQMVITQIGVATGLLLPAVQAAREAARRMQSSNNLKQISLAIHNYESIYKYIPSDTDPLVAGQTEPATNLSWRVKILPFIEQQQLYNQFHHNEPWDSPHNIKLLESMPDTFKNPNAVAKPGYTTYQMPPGEHLAAEKGKRLRRSEFTDGTSNTIGIVETRDADASPWTKPGDVNPFTNPEVLRDHRAGFQAAMMDGAVRNISKTIDPELLRKLLTRDGGERISR